MGRTSIPEYKITRPRATYYPRQAFARRARIQDELDRLLEAAKLRGLPPESVGSVYQGTPEQIGAHEKTHGYNFPWGPHGVGLYTGAKESTELEGVAWGQQIYSYRDTPVAHLAKANVDVATSLGLKGVQG